jgi:hypothetical protein
MSLLRVDYIEPLGGTAGTLTLSSNVELSGSLTVGGTQFIDGVVTCGAATGSTLRCGLHNTASSVYSSVVGGGLNSVGFDNTFSLYCTDPNTGTLYLNNNVSSTITTGCCVSYYNFCDQTIYSGVVTCSTWSGDYTEILGIFPGSARGCYSVLRLEDGIYGDCYSPGSTVSGGVGNTAVGCYPFVGGGYRNTASCRYATVSGGYRNTASGNSATVSGGYYNIASNGYATVGGGYCNTAEGAYPVVSGGGRNIASSYYATVGGGSENTASGYIATVSGGDRNIASCNYATVSGGYCNIASSYYSGILGGKCNTTAGYDCAMIIGACITADRACTTFVNNLSIKNIPTSPAGLPSGSIWSDVCNGGTLKIVS